MVKKFPPGSAVRFKRPHVMLSCSQENFFPHEIYIVAEGIARNNERVNDARVQLEGIWYIVQRAFKPGMEHRNFPPELFELVTDFEPED